jgi:microcystin degradation protein MlrC
MRIAIGGISHETNTFFPIPSGKRDLAIRRGEQILPEGGLKQHCHVSRPIHPLDRDFTWHPHCL